MEYVFQMSLSMRGVYNKESQPTTMEEVVVLTRNGELLRQPTELYRSTHHKQIKLSLPSFSPAVQFDGIGKGLENIKGFTGYVIAELDNIPDDKMDNVWNAVVSDPHTLMASISVSGNGIHIVAKGDFKLENLSYANHAAHVKYNEGWLMMNEHYERITGLACDAQCSNHNRQFLISYHKDVYMNPNAVPFVVDDQDFDDDTEFTQFTQPLKPAESNQNGYWKKEPQDKILATEEFAKKRGMDYVEHNRHNYLVFCVFHMNKLGVPRFDAERWMSQFSDRKEAERRSIVRSIYELHAAEFGIYKEPWKWVWVERKSEQKKRRKPGRPKKSDSNKNEGEMLEKAIKEYGEFRFNEVTLEYEVRTVGSKEYRPLKDVDENEICRRLLMAGEKSNVNAVRIIIQSDFTPHYHPFRAYRDSLPTCTLLPDGTCQLEGRNETVDYIGELAKRVHTTSSPKLFEHYFRIWIVALCKSLVEDDFVNQYVLGLTGTQGIYKTTFFVLLLPPELRKKYFYLKTNSNRMDKDDKLKMATNALICLEEMESMSPSEHSQFKAVVTQTSVDERPPYMRNVVHLPRIASFCMTSNTTHLLTDTTGNRRMLMFEATDIESPYGFTDYEGLYAQAFALAKSGSGFDCYIKREDMSQLNIHNERFMATILEHDLIDKYLEIPYSECTDAIWDSAGGITAYLENYTRQRLSSRKVAEYLRKKGYEYKRANANTKYRIRRLKAEQVESKMKLDSLQETMEEPF